MQISERVRLLNDQAANNEGNYVLYWMQMFKRTSYNHALNFAISEANERKLPLVVYEGLKYYYPWANDRIHTFILEGVEEKRKALAEKGILYLFYLQADEHSPRNTVAELAKDACLIVTDDFPCFIIPEHNRRIAGKARIPVYAVDSNGMIPLSKFEKEEYAAYTIRPKIKKMLPDYKKPFVEENLICRADSLIKNDDYLINNANYLINDNDSLKSSAPSLIFNEENIKRLVAKCSINHDIKPSPLYHGGSRTARKRLKHFIRKILPHYEASRNECSVDGSSRLSPYLHFGFLSVPEIVEAVEKADAPAGSKDAFLEELIVRRELSYNFTRFNPNYDSLGLSSTVGSEAWNSRDLKSRPH